MQICCAEFLAFQDQRIVLPQLQVVLVLQKLSVQLLQSLINSIESDVFWWTKWNFCLLLYRNCFILSRYKWSVCLWVHGISLACNHFLSFDFVIKLRGYIASCCFFLDLLWNIMSQVFKVQWKTKSTFTKTPTLQQAEVFTPLGISLLILIEVGRLKLVKAS